MRRLFYIIGKSASGKDTLYEELLEDASLRLAPLVTWTTRPIRAKEEEGVQYHFTDDAGLEQLRAQGRVIEARTYQTELGPWTYFTVDEPALSEARTQENDGLQTKPGRAGDAPEGQGTISTLQGESAHAADFLGIGTLESYLQIRRYYGADRVRPIYIEVDDGLRLERALKREKKPGNHKYEELCRRFLADQQDFSEENLERAGILRRFRNDGPREECLEQVKAFIREEQNGGIS